MGWPTNVKPPAVPASNTPVAYEIPVFVFRTPCDHRSIRVVDKLPALVSCSDCYSKFHSDTCDLLAESTVRFTAIPVKTQAS